MKLQIFSDLHLDVCPTKPITIADGVDVVIVAGDICEGALNSFQALRRIVPGALPVIMVMGNHEHYRRFVGQELLLASARSRDFNIHLLENDAVVIDGIRSWARRFGQTTACSATLTQRAPWRQRDMVLTIIA